MRLPFDVAVITPFARMLFEFEIAAAFDILELPEYDGTTEEEAKESLAA